LVSAQSVIVMFVVDIISEPTPRRHGGRGLSAAGRSA
jgi:hypothetical protein